MPTYSKDSLEKLRQRINLLEVLSSHLEMKPSGSAYKALCPFHDEKTPSFMMQKGDSHYHCFGCGAHGDAIQFLMTHVKMNFSDAVESLAQKFQVPLEIVEHANTVQGPNKTLLKEALEHASQFFHFYLLHTNEGHVALQYLYQRGLELDFIQHFQIGLAPATAGLLQRYLQSKAVKTDIMIAAGLLKEKNGYEFFSDRITFPIRDPMGAVIGFSGRKYKEETFGGKYINTPETPLFKKSRVLFGFNYSRKRIAKERKAIIVEGQIDALRLIHAGFDFTVAGQGTAFGEGHVQELVNLGVSQVFIALDGDEAGQLATSKIGHLFLRAGIEVRVVHLPNKQDPDSYLRQYGPDKFRKLLDASTDYISFQVYLLSKKYALSSPAGKNQLIQEVSSQIRSWEHPVLVHESLRKLAQVVKVPETMLGVGQDHVPNLYIKKTDSIGVQSIDADRILEGDFLRWLLFMGSSLPKLFAIAENNLSAEDFKVPLCRMAYQKVVALYKDGKDIDLLTLSIELDTSEMQQLLAEIADKKINRDKALPNFLETLQKILDRNWMHRREAIRIKLHSGESSDEEAMQLVKAFDQLKSSPPQIKL